MKKIDVTPYPVNVWLTNTHDRYVRKASSLMGAKEDTPGKNCAAVCFYTDDRLNIVIGLFDDSAFSLVHEVTHAVLRIFEAVGMEICHETTEAHAYLTEHVYRQCWKIHDKLREAASESEEDATP